MWDELLDKADFKAVLSAHFARALSDPCEPEWVSRIVDAATSIERSTFSSRTPLEGQTALKVRFPKMEDGVSLEDEEFVTLYCAAPFDGVARVGVPPSIQMLCAVHNGFVVESRSDVIGFFEGLDASGALASSRTLEMEGPAVDCFPDGWAWFDSDEQRFGGEIPIRWVGEELRSPGDVLWPGESTGAIVFQSIAAIVLGYTLPMATR
jgi:hypothetical protein